MQNIPASKANEINWLHVSPFLLYLLFSPIYLLSSGLPQIADGIILIGIISIFIGAVQQKKTQMRVVFFIGICFALYTICINIINYTYFPHTRFLFSGIYYLYNVMVFIYVVTLFEKYELNLKKVVLFILMLSVIAEFLWALIMPQNHWREIGSFNNPNQLAYWSLLTALMIILLRKNKNLDWKELGVIGVLGAMQTLALSKVGIISYSLFLLILICSPLINHTKRSIIMGLLMVISAIGLFAADSTNLTQKFIEMPIERLKNIGQEPDDSTEARGYTRPLNFPAYAIFGAGEGAYERFEPHNPLELHSAIVTILFSYGLFGFALFATFLAHVLNKKPIHIILLFVPIFMIGLTGQSFRFTHFWILLAIAYVSYKNIKYDNKS